MTWEQWEHQVLETLNDTTDQNTHMVAETTATYTRELRAGNISQVEYIELMLDIQRQLTITDNLAEFETKQRLNTAITGLISLASLI
jgi:hypothetical protein